MGQRDLLAIDIATFACANKQCTCQCGNATNDMNNGTTRQIDEAFRRLDRRLPGVITSRSGLGAMQAFTAWSGDPEITREIVASSLDEGVLFQTAGSKPMKIRILPPLTLTTRELEDGFETLECVLRQVGERHGLIDSSPD